MRNRWSGIMTLLIVLMQAIPQAPAQSVRIEVNIPVEFVVGNTSLPAGHYRIEPIAPHVSWLVGSDASHSLAIFATVGIQVRDTRVNAELVFNRYGSTYFLSQIWSPESNTGRQLLKSKLERRIAQGSPTPDKLELVVPAIRAAK